MKIPSVRQEIATGLIKSTGAGKLITCAGEGGLQQAASWSGFSGPSGLFSLVHRVGLVQPDKQDKPNNGLLLLDLHGGREATLSASVEELKTF